MSIVFLILRDQLVVFGMTSDPEPEQAFGDFHRQRTKMDANPDRIICADLFQVERGMIRVGIEKNEVFIRKFTHVCGKFAMAYPESRGGKVPQISRAFPAS